jgi:RNA polymerase sigma factor (sigma-70 family)
MKNYELTTTKRNHRSDFETGFDLRNIYVTFYNDLYFYGLKISGSEDLTRDCIQDMFTQFWSNSESLCGVKSVRAYLLKCFRRRVIEQLNAEKRYLNNYLPEGRYEYTGVAESHESDLVEQDRQNELTQRLLKATGELTARQQEILFLKFNLGYSYDSICDIMNIKYQSVRNLLSETVKYLRKTIEADRIAD